jgi:HK97 gp10 family phage protein
MAGDFTLRAAAVWKPRDDLGQFVSSKIAPAAAVAVKAWGDAVLERAQQIVPVDTGELRDSGHVVVIEEENRCYARVQFDADHAGYVEWGTGLRGASSAGAGDLAYSSTWPGMPAQPYLRPASDEVKIDAMNLVKQQVALALL